MTWKDADYAKKYYEMNKEKILKRVSAYQAERREEIKRKKAVYRKANRERILAQKAAYRIENVEKIKASKKIFRQGNKEKIARELLNWRLKNIDYKAEVDAAYYKKNKKIIHAKQSERLRVDINFRLAACLRKRICSAVREGRKSGSSVRDLGCSIEFLRIYLAKKFKTGMTWDNWGRGKGKWHIDHIRPLCSFDLTDRKQFLEACHHTNLQPLWSHENISKGGRI